MTSKRFTRDVAVALENADRKIRSLSSNSHHLIYHFWRITMEKICRVDAFYVGFFRETNRIFFPYSFDVTGYDDPEELKYGADGICAWILKNKRPYTYSQDNGFLLHNGQRFGDLTRSSADAIVIPLLDPTDGGSRVMGMASVQSYEPNSYDPEAVRALQWLARSVVTALLREREDAINRRELGISEADRSGEGTATEIAEEMNRRLRDLRRRVEAIQGIVPAENVGLGNALAELQFECEQLQTNALELLTRPMIEADDLFALLTPREKEVAILIAKGYTNYQIADELGIDLDTVKTHVSRILDKFGERQRAGVAARLNLLRGRAWR